jgi:3-deoxy-D-manno-octulosonic-acid transferase
MSQRFGFLDVPEPGARDRVWVHAASVGETAAAAPILAALGDISPGVEIIFTNITATGHATAVRMFPDAHCLYFPFDFPFAIRRALELVRPRVCITVETELWPNFIHLSRQAGARVAVVNGRISDRSFRRVRKWPVTGLFRWMFDEMDGLYVQTAMDAERARALGARPEIIEVLGNSKFDGAVVDDPLARAVATEMGFPPDGPTLVAGSTHAGEDEAVLDAFIEVRQKMPSARLIIAPRRLERSAGLGEALQRRGLTARFRSREKDAGTVPEYADGDTSVPVLVLDTLGELRRVYALARVAFVGGTLVPVGGHDLLQPLAKSKPVIFGPHTANCREIATAVLERPAGIQVGDTASLAAAWLGLLQDHSRAQAMGAAGMALIQESQGAARRYAERIVALMQSDRP